MDKSYKRFGYGFSALVLALSSTVIIPSVANAADPVPNCGTATGQTPYVEAKDTATLLTAGACVKLTADITTDAYPVSQNTRIDLNGNTLSVPITVADGVSLTIVNGSAKTEAALSTAITLGKGSTLTIDGDIAVKASGSTLVTYANSANAGVVTFADGTFTATTLVANSDGTAISAGKVAISGGDFTGVDTIVGSAVAGAAVVTGGVFASDPTKNTGISVDEDTYGIFTEGAIYVVADASKVTKVPSAAVNMVADVDKTVFFTLTPGAVSDGADGFIMNDLTFTVTDGDDAELVSGTAAEISEYFTVTKSTNQGTDKDDPTDDTYTYTFIANKGGSYKVTATSLDGQESDAVAVTVYEFNSDAAFKNIYVPAQTGTDTVAIDLEDAVIAFVGKDNASKVTFAESSDGVEVSGQTITVGASAPATAEITYAVAGTAVTGTFNLNVIASAELTPEFIDMVEDEDEGGYTPIQAATQVDTMWSIASVKGSAVEVERVLDTDGNETKNLIVTPTAVGTGIVTFNLNAEDAWAIDEEGNLVTDEADVAEAVKGVNLTGAIYTYRVNDGMTLKYTPADDEAGTPAVTTSEQATGIIEVDTNEIAVTAKKHGDDTIPGVTISSDGTTITSSKADTENTLDFALSDGTNNTTVSSVVIYTYSDETVDLDDVVKSFNIADGETKVYTLDITNENVELELAEEYDNVEIDGNDVMYTPESVGTETITVNAVLGETVLDTFEIKVNVYGLDLQSVYYVEPGAELSIENVADPFGTVRISNITDPSGDLYTGYSFENGTFTFSADEEGSYKVIFRDAVDIDEEGAANDWSDIIYPTITIKVAETYITTDTEAVAFDITDGADASDAITVSKTAGTVVATVESAYDEEGVYDSNSHIKWSAISTKNGTYKVTADATTLPGDYVLTLSLVDTAGNTIDSTEIAINVIKLADADDVSGVFTIYSALGKDMVLDINGGSTADGGNVQIYKSNDTLAQQYLIEESDTEGYYTIKNLHSSKLLDVTAGYAADGTNIQQYEGNDTKSQLWRIQYANGIDTADEVYTFVSALDDSIVLDVAGGAAKNGTNVQAYTSNSTASQQWTFKAVPTSDAIVDITGAAIKDTKIYTIASALNSNMVIDVAGAGTANATNVQLYTANDTVAQQWIFEADEAGLYTITNTNSGKVLDVQWGGSTNGTNVQIYESNDTTAQKWILTQDSNTGFVTFESVNSGLVLDIDAGRAADGTNAQIYKSNGTKSQQFRLIEVK